MEGRYGGGAVNGGAVLGGGAVTVIPGMLPLPSNTVLNSTPTLATLLKNV